MDTLKRLVRFGSLTFVTCVLFMGCATVKQPPVLMIEASAEINSGVQNIVCRTEAALLELAAYPPGKRLEDAFVEVNEKHVTEYKSGICAFGMFGYVVVAPSAPPRLFESRGVQYTVQRIAIFIQQSPEGESVAIFKKIIEGYRGVRVIPRDVTEDPI